MNDSYIKKFESAYRNTKWLGLKVSKPHQFINKTYFNNAAEKTAFLNEINRKYLSFESVLDLALHCHTMNVIIQKIISDEIGCNSWITTGSANLSGMQEYSMSKWSAQKLISRSGRNQELSDTAHSWLTLDNGEILDITLYASMRVYKFLKHHAVVLSDLISGKTMRHIALLGQLVSEETQAKVYFGQPCDFKNYDISPVVIGRDFLNKGISGFSSKLSLLQQRIAKFHQENISGKEKWITENLFQAV